MATITTKPARNKQPAAGEIIEPDPPETEESYLPDDVAILDLLADLGDNSDAVVRIYREGKGGFRDLTLLSEVGAKEFTPIMLAQPPYNGGTFRIHARSRSGILMNRQLKVEPAPQPATATVNTAPAVTLEAVAELVTRAVSAAMAPLIHAQQAQPTRAQTLEEFKALADILRPAQLSQSGPDPWEMMTKALSVVTQLKGADPAPLPEGGATTNDLLLGVMREFGPMVRSALDKSGPAAVAGSPALPAPPAPLPAQSQQLPQPQQPQQPEGDDMNLRLKMALSFLCVQAKADNPVDTYADMALDNVPEEELRPLLEAPDYLERLAAFHGDVRNYAPWFAKLRDEVLALLNDTGDGDEAPPAVVIVPPVPGAPPAP